MTSTKAGTVLLGWLLFGLTGVLRTALLSYAFDRPVGRWELLSSLVAALAWATLTPLAAWIVRTFPLATGRHLRGVSALLVAGPVLAVLHQAIFFLAYLVFWRGSLGLTLYWNGLLRTLSTSFVRVLMVAWPFLAVLHAVAMARREQEAAFRTARLEAEVAEATLATARAEVDPAFLLRTLDDLGPLILRDRPAAEEVIVRIGDLLRARDGAPGATRPEIAREIRDLFELGLRPRSRPAGS